MHGGKTILLLEEDAFSALHEISLFERNSFTVISADTTEKALEAVRRNSVDIVLINISFQEGTLDSVEAARCILAETDLPIVFLTDHTEKEYAEKAGEVPNYGYIAKNGGAYVILACVRTALNLFETQVRLKRKEIEAREIVNNIDSAILQYDRAGKIIYFSRSAEKIFGYRAAEIVGTTGVGTINPPVDSSGGKQGEMLSDIIRQPEKYSYQENENTCEDGRRIWVAWRNKAVTDDTGNVLYVQSIGNDITGTKEAEESLRKSLREKEYLLKELNHRVKNNLAMITSLIHLKNYSLENGVDLSDIERQINAIRIVHEKLYQTGDILHIEFRDYIDDLLQTIFSSFFDKPVTLENTIGNFRISTKKAIALGLIINEIAANAIQHGFLPGADARFTIFMERDDAAASYTLKVGNSGNPFPPEIGLDNPETLGLRLITALVDQLEGTVELRRAPTPLFTIVIPLENGGSGD